MYRTPPPEQVQHAGAGSPERAPVPSQQVIVVSKAFNLHVSVFSFRNFAEQDRPPSCHKSWCPVNDDPQRVNDS